jgi:hypothetical protein
MADDLASIEFFFPEQHPQERTLAGAVAAHEPDLNVVRDGRIGAIQQHLIAVTLVNVLDLQQHAHAR